MQSLPSALAPMANYNQFILYKLIPKPKLNKTLKLPVDHRTLQVMKKDEGWQENPEYWTTFDNALAISKILGNDYGVGFFFTADDPFFFVDIDKCGTSDGWSPVALDILRYFPNAAIEVSQSGTGLHIFGTGNVPDHVCRNDGLGVEFYTERRFVALTGNVNGDAGVNCDTYMQAFVNTYVPPKTTTNPVEWSNTPHDEWSGPNDDEKLIEKALNSKSAASVFGGRASFKDLWNRNIDVLADVYSPDDSSDKEYNGSTVDAALAQHLAFWTGNDCERMLRLMWKSQLVRDKWKRDAYMRETIMKAVSLQTAFHSDRKKEQPRISIENPTEPMGQVEAPTLVEGFQFLGISQQLEHFKGCVYIQDIHRIFTPTGSKLRSDQFNATYGGYVFQLESNASGKVTRKAWEAFTESQAVRYQKAESSCFKPNMEPGAVINKENRLLVNTYVPINIHHVQGDITPFLDHMALVLPDQHDRNILMAYMAACVQHKGTKFQWAPLLQGAEGNGKTLFSECVAYAVGERYSHMPRAEQITEKFNTWLFDTLFIGVEDIYVPDHKIEVIEILKPMITARRFEKRGMQTDQIMRDICCNFIFNSNYKNAVRKTRNDRRFCIFYSAQQTSEDIIRDGMDGNYFPELYRWLKESNGFAIVAHYLENYSIPDSLNPATSCNRAPVTSSTNEAITASLGGVEQEIIEAIEEGRQGFANGWVSSMALNKLIDGRHMSRAIPPNKRREILQSLGYDWHPALKNGRTNNPVMMDGGKTKLFIKEGHIHLNLTSPAEVVKHYQEAQGAFAPGVDVHKHSDQR